GPRWPRRWIAPAASGRSFPRVSTSAPGATSSERRRPCRPRSLPAGTSSCRSTWAPQAPRCSSAPPRGPSRPRPTPPRPSSSPPQADLDRTLYDSGGAQLGSPASFNAAGLFGSTEGVTFYRPVGLTAAALLSFKSPWPVDQPFTGQIQTVQAVFDAYGDMAAL